MKEIGVGTPSLGEGKLKLDFNCILIGFIYPFCDGPIEIGNIRRYKYFPCTIAWYSKDALFLLQHHFICINFSKQDVYKN